MADDDVTTPPSDDGPPETPAQPSGLTAEQVQGMLQQALTPFATALRSMHARVESFEHVRPEAAAPAGGNDIEQLVPGLSTHISSAVEKVAREMISPLLQPLMDDKVVDLVERHAAQFDAEFGPGSWDKYAKADVDQILQNLPPNQRISARHLKTAVDALKGRNFDQLSKARVTQTQQRAAAAPLMPTGRSAAGSGGPTLSEDETLFIAELSKATGEKIDPKAYAIERELGNTEDSWREYLKSGGAKH